MKRTLLEQFLEEECTPHVGDLLRATLEEGKGGTDSPRKHFEFNRFEVTLDFAGGTALIEDVLDSTEAGVQRVSIEELRAALSGIAGRRS